MKITEDWFKIYGTLSEIKWDNAQCTYTVGDMFGGTSFRGDPSGALISLYYDIRDSIKAEIEDIEFWRSVNANR